MHFLAFLVLVVHAAAFYVTAPIERPIATHSTAISTSDVKSQSSVAESTSVPSLPSMTFSSLMTIAPLSRNPLELRQRCFNDQGFSVDCATWTGYYYTWGGAGHPYAGGPGEGGGSGGSSNNAITGIIGTANRLEALKLPGLVALVTVCLLLLL